MTSPLGTAGDDRFLLRHDRAVQAGAGTGKTHALVTQYLHLCAGLSAHGRALEPRQIAAMTFTEKAAGEMLERIRARLAALVLALGKGEDAAAAAEPALFQSAAALGRRVPGAAHFERTLQQLGSAQVGTFHSFAGGLLRRYPALSRVDPDFLLLEQDSANDLELEATERTVLAALEGAEELTGGPTARETAALLGEYGFRGVGGGEALVELLCRVRARRAEDGLGAAGLAAAYDDEALRQAFLAAREQLLDGLRRLGALGEVLGDKSAALARELGAVHDAVAAALGSPAQVPAALPLLEGVLAGLGRLRGRKDDAAGQQTLADVKAALRQAHRDLGAAHQTELAAPLARTFERLLCAAWRAYDEAKGRLGALDFTDLLSRARDLLRDHPPARQQLRDRFAAVLVDECQDTNPLQAELLLLLAGPPAERGDAPGRLYVVGDRKQSIYEFRGADVATFQGLQRAIADAGGDEETLSVSRRSRPGVLRFANALFAQVMQVPPEGFREAVSSADTPVPVAPPGGAALAPGAAEGAWPAGAASTAGAATPAGAWPAWPAWIVRWDPLRDPLEALRSDGGDEPAAELLRPLGAEAGEGADVAEAVDVAAPGAPARDPAEAVDGIGAEAQLMARHILTMREEGRRFGDMAMLLWRFTHLPRYLLALRQAGIPYYVIKGRGFYEAQELRDVCAALTLLDDPEDTLSLVALLRSPLCGVSDDTLTRLHLSGCLKLEALQRGERPAAEALSEAESARLRGAVELLRGLAETGDRLGPSACLRALYDGGDLPPALLAGPEGEQRVANLELLLRRAEQFEEAGGGLRAFIRWLRLQCDPALPGDALSPQAQIVSEQDDVVRVMTVHQSKGLEFPVVLLPGCSTRERSDVGAVSYDRDVGLGLALRRGGERQDTLPSLRIQQLRRLRAEAESARLFYVAVTRARDRVVFAGEGRRSKGTWRAHLDALGEGGGLVTRRHPLGPLAPPPPPPVEEPAPESARVAAAQALQRAYGGALPSSPAGEAPAVAPPPAVELPLAAAVDLVLCPRRYHLRRVLLLSESPLPDVPPPPVAAEEESAPEDRLREGTLVHRLLGRADLQRGGAELEALLLADGYDPQQPQVAEVLTRAARLLASRRFQALCEGGAPRRRVPYRVQVAPALTLRGQLDALLREGELLTVLDYRYGYLPPVSDGEHLRRGALGAVAGALFPGAAAVRVGLAYLREPDPSPLLAPVSKEASAESVALLAAAAPAASLGERQARALPPLPLSRCHALGCGYVARCHGRAP